MKEYFHYIKGILFFFIIFFLFNKLFFIEIRLSAGLLRQATYTTTRLGVFQVIN